jgi:3-deoxy-manno-octulosonate cytidylyltransferase (CMP-KDO synthetase)
MSFIVIIPARYSSSRLPGKPLVDIGGKPMIQRVYELAEKSKADEIYIATDHNDIIDCCSSFGAKALMTNSQHPSGTDRIAETSKLLNLSSDSVVINVQGDEPFLNFLDIDNLADFFKDYSLIVAKFLG